MFTALASPKLESAAFFCVEDSYSLVREYKITAQSNMYVSLISTLKANTVWVVLMQLAFQLILLLQKSASLESE